jgi:hypothetical protein
MGRLDHKDWLAPNEVLKIFANIRDPSLITGVFNKACNRRDYKPSEALYSLMIDKLACARRFSDVEELLARARTEKFRFSDEFFYRLINTFRKPSTRSLRCLGIIVGLLQRHSIMFFTCLCVSGSMRWSMRSTRARPGLG